MHRYDLRPHHRRRHRKKLRLAEFAELGFPVRASLPDAPPSGGSWEEVLQAFLDQQGWSWDGEPRPLDGFVSRFGGGSLTDVDRTLMQAWLVDQGAGDVCVGPLQDRWEWVTQ